MKGILGTAALAAAMALAAPAQAAYVEVANLMTGNPYGAQVMVEDVRYADGGSDAPSRQVERTLRIGDGTVTGFVLVTQTSAGGLAFSIQCSPDAAYARIEVENPWAVSANGACQIARRGSLVPGNMIRWQ
jgi:hypothetical protein